MAQFSDILSTSYSVLFSVIYTLFVLPFGYFFLFVHKLFPSVFTKKHVQYVAYYYGKCFLLLNSPVFPVKIKDKHFVRNISPCIIIANHQSILDLFLFGMQSEKDFIYVVKSWPFKILFFFAPIMRAIGYINIDEYTTEEVEEQCVQFLQNGTSIVIFPEGKRTRNKKIGKFYSGAFKLAIKTNRPIAPLVFENCYDIFPPDKKILSSGTIYISHLPALFPKDFLDADMPHRKMMKYAQEQYIEYFNLHE